MKMRKIFQAVFAAFTLTAVFLGCSNLVESDEKENSTSSKQGRILLSVPASARAASTIYPNSNYDFEKDSGLTFTLQKGDIVYDEYKNMSFKNWTEIRTWSDSDDKKAYAAMVTDTSIDVDAGEYVFLLDVANSTGTILSGKIAPVIISAGETMPLEFELSESGTQKGTINFTLSFPANSKVVGAKAMLSSNMKLTPAPSYTSSSSLDISTSVEKSSVTYKTTIAPGNYILIIKLYSDTDCTTCMNTYMAIAHVAQGLTSSGSAELTDVNTIYNITYKLNGGEISNSIKTSYNKHEKFALPDALSVYKYNYTFIGWATSENGAKIYDGGEEISVSEDTTLYALWELESYKITYEMNLDGLTNSSTVANSNSNVATYTSEDNITLYEPTYDKNEVEYVFDGWYEDENFTEKITSFNGEDYSSDITLYAKWKYVWAKEIEEMTTSGKITVTGKLNAKRIRQINEALKTHSTDNVYVSLDLTKATDLTELEDAYSYSSSNSFYECKQLKSISLPDSVTSIGKSAFSGCYGLTEVNLPKNLTSIGKSAFYSCILTSVTIPDKVTSIGDTAFYNCQQLYKLTFSDSLTSIGNSAFYNCKKLSSITIPKNVTSIEKYAFGNCSNLNATTFKDPEGWSCKQFDSSTPVELSSSDLSSTFKASAYLVGTYSDYQWSKQ